MVERHSSAVLDRIEVGGVGRKELRFEVMPVHARRFVPGGIVEDEQLAHAFFFRHGPGHFIQKELKDVRVDSINDQTEERTALRRDGPDHILPNVIAQIGNGAAFTGLHPAAARSGITFHPAFIAEPKFHLRIGHPDAQLFQKHFAILLILAFGPGLREAQMEIQFVQPTNGRAVAEFHLQLLLEIAVEFDAGPMHLADLRRIFQDRHEQIAHSLKFDFARATGFRTRDQRINATAIEQLDPEPHHPIGPTELLADCRAGNAQKKRADRGEPNIGAHIRRGLHRHFQLIERGIFSVRMQLR
jgi:hypothetical protein